MHGPLNREEQNRLERMPAIGRARGYRLYALNGTRWLDCWLDDSRALLGHRPSKVSIRLKNEVDRGLYAPYPNRWTRRFEQSLMRLFPGYSTARFYRNTERALDLLGLDQNPTDPMDLPDDLDAFDGALWGRPLLPGHPKGSHLFTILPLPGLTDVQAVLTNDSAMPPSDPVSPIILASLTRSCASASSFPAGKPPEFRESSDIWKRRGPYMNFRGSEEDYDVLFESLIIRHILIAPSIRRPSVMPMEISDKEAAMLDAGSSSR
ncbi:MAG: hypothetical protein RQ801_02245 [Spirochaetaceae bacterium]|nr:hypothetical protein [Spirochaetaceae bacterium]MDT8297095.1 hypothetical protein [Spirochaetaceae bacterium]